MFSHFLRKLGALGQSNTDVVEAGGYFWQMEPAGVAVFGPNGPNLADLPSVLVKTNLQRTIVRVTLPNDAIYVKTCRANTPRSWAREILRPAKARLEFENARSLAKLGIAAIEPLAWGSRSSTWPGDSVLVTRERKGAEPFLEFLEAKALALSTTERSAIIREFASFLARLHEAGVTHPDPHPGNFLLEWQSNEPRFALIDLHAIRFGKPLDWPKTRKNLTLLNRWFQLRTTAAERARFWKAYRLARHTITDDGSQSPREVERETVLSNNRFWTARLARYRGNNRDSCRVRGPAAAGYAVRELPKDLVESWLCDPDRAFAMPGVKVVKDSRSSTVAEIAIATPDGPKTVIYKRFRVKNWYGLLKNAFRQSQALRSWTLGNNVRDRGLPTARPLAAFERRRFGIPRAGYVVFEKVPDAVELDAAVAGLNELQRPAVLEIWAERIGRLLRLMHERQVSHRDLKAANILMSGPDPLLAEPVLIDLVGVEVGREVPRPVRVRDLARLNASFLNSPSVRFADRLRLLRAYLGPASRGDWKSWWKSISEATQSKVARNRRTGRVLG